MSRKAECGLTMRLQNAFALLRGYFGVQPKMAQLPSCVRDSRLDWKVVFADIESPTNHERLEAHQQLQTWAAGRGLSFD